jgi:hypothetical protein
MYVCSSYYKAHELARRNTLIQIFTQVGPFFSGFLMAAVFAGLDCVRGMPGSWWMYMGVPITESDEAKLTRAAFAVLSPSLAPSGRLLLRLNFPVEQSTTGSSPKL